jgi:hypothetical protein
LQLGAVGMLLVRHVVGDAALDGDVKGPQGFVRRN